MKYFHLVLYIALWHVNAAEYSTVFYNVSNASIINPERGFYQPTEVYSTSPYVKLTSSELNSYQSQGFSLILRVFYLHNFRTVKISKEYLKGIEEDLTQIRNARVKIIVRFAYSNSNEKSASPWDASKATILQHISQLKPILRKYADIIATVQAGFIGVWGEWYYSSNFGQSDLTPTNYADRKEILEALLAALPSIITVQLRIPDFKRKMYTTNYLTNQAAYKGTSVSRIGHHNDCFLASDDDFGTYINADDKSYLAEETKYVPMGGETCAVNPPRSECASALVDLKEFHWTYLNIGYNADVIKGFKDGGCFDEIKNKLGYRFELISARLPSTVKAGGRVNISLELNNNGFASVYSNRKVYLVLINTANNKNAVSIKLATDPRLWQPGKYKLNEIVTIPAFTRFGSYGLHLYFPDPNSILASKPLYSIRLANENMWDSVTGMNNLQKILQIQK